MKPQYFLIIVVCVLLGCKHPNRKTKVDVYIAGWLDEQNNNLKAMYWVNGVVKPMADSSSFSVTNAIAVSDTDVYIAGFAVGNAYLPFHFSDSSGNSIAAYWKNGKKVALTRISLNAEANGIAINGKDVYVVGKYIKPNGHSTAAYWKNGTPTPLFIDSALSSEGGAIAINGPDVFVAGIKSDFTPNYTPVYWKNGKAKLLMNQPDLGIQVGGYASSIIVKGKDVYITGFDTVGVYWKNNVRHVLAGGKMARPNGMVVNGNDVYVAGCTYQADSAIATYWKNGIATKLTTTKTDARARAIAVYGNDVYVVGDIDYVATLWKNGKRTQLNKHGSAEAITIAEH